MKKRLALTLLLVLTLIFSATAVVIGVSASESEPALEVKHGALSLEDSVNMLFLVGYENISAPEDIELLIWVGDGIHVDDCVKGNEHYSIKSSEQNTETQEATFRFDGLAAAEMTKNVYVKAYYDGTYSEPFKYSILQYAYNMLGITKESSATDELKNVLLEMLAYGAAAQQYFGENTESLATDTYRQVTVVGGELPDGMNSGLYEVGTKVILTATPTEELPYVIWSNANGQTVAVGNTYEYTVTDENTTVTATLSAESSSFGMYNYVVVIGVDGAGTFRWRDSEGVAQTSTPNIDAIFANGAQTEQMFINAPTSSGPSWASHLHGVLPEHHGIYENEAVEADGASYTNSKYPSFLKLVKEAYPDERVGALYSWCGINGCVEDGVGIDEICTNNNDTDLMNYITGTYLKDSAPKALFVHLHAPDAAGHGYGYSADVEQYATAIADSDADIGEIYAAYEALGILDETLFIVTADHGGTGTTHGGQTDAEQYVLFAVAGKTVKNGGTIDGVDNRDTAAIALYALGIAAPETYTGCIPENLFDGVSAEERPVYHDPDNPRDVVPTDTPALGSGSYVTDYVDKELINYLPLDGTATDTQGATVTEGGIVNYIDGYFGSAASLDRGYLTLDGFAPGTDSFTVTFWMKTPAHHGSSVILSNGQWGTTGHGFNFVAERLTGPIQYYTYFNIGNGEAGCRIKTDLDPAEVVKGWTHVTLVVDRANNELRMCYDFGEFTTVEIASDRGSTDMSVVDLTTVYEYLVIGQDAGYDAEKAGLTVDEFMVWNGAFTNKDLNALVEYYNKTPIVDEGAISVFDNDTQPEVYLDFNGDLHQEGSQPSGITATGTSTYGSGYDGTESGSIYFSGTNYATLEDVKLGTGSFSFSFWLNPTDLTNGNTSSDRWIFALLSTSVGDGREDAGLNVLLNNERDYLAITMGSDDVTDGAQYQYSLPADTYENRWTHITISVNKDGDSDTLEVYYDFVKVSDINGNTTNFITCYGGAAFPQDADMDAMPFTVGQYASPLTKTPKVYMDDLMIFNRAVTEADVAKLKDYYINPVSDYLGEDKAPELYLGFDGNLNTEGTLNTTVTETGTTTYGSGYNGVAGTSAYYSGSNYQTVEDLKLENGDFTVSFWINPTNLTMGGASRYKLPIVSTAAGLSRENLGMNILLDLEYNNLAVTIGDGTAGMQAICTLSGNIAVNEWTHVAVSMDRTNSKLVVYFNFVEVYSTDITYYNSSTKIPADLSADAQPFTIGEYGTADTNHAPLMYLDELMVFRSALTADDVVNLESYFSQINPHPATVAAE